MCVCVFEASLNFIPIEIDAAESDQPANYERKINIFLLSFFCMKVCFLRYSRKTLHLGTLRNIIPSA